MTKPIDGVPSYSYRPPELNLPVGNLDTSSEQDSDIVNKIPYNNVNKYQNVNRPSEEASPHNKISSSLSLIGARPMAVAEQHAENSIPTGNNFIIYKPFLIVQYTSAAISYKFLKLRRAPQV